MIYLELSQAISDKNEISRAILGYETVLVGANVDSWKWSWLLVLMVYVGLVLVLAGGGWSSRGWSFWFVVKVWFWFQRKNWCKKVYIKAQILPKIYWDLMVGFGKPKFYHFLTDCFGYSADFYRPIFVLRLWAQVECFEYNEAVR